MRRLLPLLVTPLLPVLLLPLACSEPAMELPESCQPLLGGADCTLPYPSDYFLEEDASTVSGRAVVMKGAAKPLTALGESADVTDWKKSDGFSRQPLIVALLGSEMIQAGLVSVFDDYARSTTLTSPTLIVDAETLELVPHFADIDPRPTDPLRRSITLRPQVQLKEQSRYIAVLQGVMGPAGLATAPEGFRRLRDKVADPSLDAERFETEIFTKLEALGLERAGLQLAWDFTTQSEISVIQDLLDVRELVLADLEANPPTVEIDIVLEDEQPEIWRTIIGRVTGPLVVEHAFTDAALARDDDGRVRLNGVTEIGFSINIPTSVRDAAEPGIALEYGHGFFGLRDEITYSRERRMFNNMNAVAFSVDWWGMMEDDIGTVLSDLGFDVQDAVSFTDRLHQGMANWLTLTAAIQGALTENDALVRDDGSLSYDQSAVHYMGISQGHILGGVHVALNPDIQRAVLHVGGAGWMHIAMRAEPFSQYLNALNTAMPDELDQIKAMATFQMHFDRMDPATLAPFVTQRELPTGDSGASTRRVLMQAALGDSFVPNFSTYFHARVMGIPMLTPSPAEVFGLDETTGGATSALAVFDVGEDPRFAEVPVPPEENNDAHKFLRTTDQSQLQIETFLRTGEIVHPCEGPCVIPNE